MLVPLSWLNELLPTLLQHLLATDLEPTFAKLGLPLEGISLVPAPPDGVIFGVVQRCEAIPETHLYLLHVDIGGDIGAETKTIVTGASNAKAGVGVAVAKPGTRIGDLEVGMRMLQGLESWGMTCSPAELGVGEYGGGLLLLPVDTAPAGTPLNSIWATDSVLDVEVTPNRADALSILGVARDLAAYLNIALQPPSAGVQPDSSHSEINPTINPEINPEINPALTLEILPETTAIIKGDPSKQARAGCSHFVARRAMGVQNGPSPLHLQRRLLLCGQRPINLVVDASNYVMLELGQPTAFYDARDLPGRSLKVTFPIEGEIAKTLDGAEYSLEAGDLLIRNAENQIVGIAGTKGGWVGRIQEDSSEVVLEAAHFDPIMIRKTSGRLGLKTDAAYRFERGTDPNLPLWAANRIMELLEQHGGATVTMGFARAGKMYDPPLLSLDPQYCRDLLGMDIHNAEIEDNLARLGCETTLEGGLLRVKPPSWRVDLHIPEDLIEEVARLHGFHELPETLPPLLEHSDNIGADREAQQRNRLKTALTGLGFSEVVSYSFSNDQEATNARAELPHIKLKNPLTADRTGMRTALYPSLLNAAVTNSAEKSLLLFELGRIFPLSGEVEHLGVLMRGNLAPSSWTKELTGGFFVFKALLESFAAKLGATLELRPVQGVAYLHPGICGMVLWNGQNAGVIGAVHPAVAQKWGLKGETFILELTLPLTSQSWTFADPSRQPAALRDLAIIAPLGVAYSDMLELIHTHGGPSLESVDVFDVYQGAPIIEGSRSVGVKLTYRSSHTLKSEEIEHDFLELIGQIKAAGLSIRES